MATKGGAGSTFNDEYPLEAGQRRPKERRRTVHIVIHRLWRQDSRLRSVVYWRERRRPGLVTVVVRTVGSRRCGHPRFVVCRHFVIETALAEANSFLGGCQPFCNIVRGFDGGCCDSLTAGVVLYLLAPPGGPPGAGFARLIFAVAPNTPPPRWVTVVPTL